MAKNIEITKPVTIEVDETTYTLEFNRNSVAKVKKKFQVFKIIF